MIPFFRKKTNEIKKLISEKLDHPNVILVEGPRQVGKTTTVEICLRENKILHLELNLEKNLMARDKIDACRNFEDFTYLLKDDFNFEPNGQKVLFIDEAQESRKLGSFVRSMKEDWQNTKVILTGSMMARLFRNDVRYPVGRVKTVHIQGLSFAEFLRAKNSNSELPDIIESANFSKISPLRHKELLNILNDYLMIGGLPEVVKSAWNKGGHEIMLRQILENYRQDFMRVFGEELAYLFENAMRGVADHVGSPSKITQAVSHLDSAYRKMSEVFTRLENWNMIYLSQQRGGYPEGTTLMHPKRYLFDLGLLNKLRTAGTPSLKLLENVESAHRKTLGGIIENFVAFHLMEQDHPLCGFRKNTTGLEIDFVIKNKNQIIPLECKATLRSKDSHLTGLKVYMREFNQKLGILASLAPFEIHRFSEGTIIRLPIYAMEALPAILSQK